MAHAICPACGGRIPVRGLLGIKTFGTCVHCQAALSGKMIGRRGELAVDGQAREDAKTRARGVKQAGREAKRVEHAEFDERLVELVRAGPVSTVEAARRLGVPRQLVDLALIRLSARVKAQGFGRDRTLTLR